MAEQKITKDAAKYERAKSSTKRCGTCSMFRPPLSCTLVKGEIAASAVCKYWEARKQ